MEKGSGAHRNARIITTTNNFLRFSERGDMSSSGLTSGLLMLNIKTKSAIT